MQHRRGDGSTEKLIGILAANGDIEFVEEAEDEYETYDLTDKGRKRAEIVFRTLSAEEAILVAMLLRGLDEHKEE